MGLPEHPRRAEGERLLREGQAVADVAREIGAGERTVQRWAARLGLARERGQRGRGAGEPGPLAQEAIGRLLDGQDVAQIAADLRCTQARVRQIRADFTDGEVK